MGAERAQSGELGGSWNWPTDRPNFPYGLRCLHPGCCCAEAGFSSAGSVVTRPSGARGDARDTKSGGRGGIGDTNSARG